VEYLIELIYHTPRSKCQRVDKKVYKMVVASIFLRLFQSNLVTLIVLLQLTIDALHLLIYTEPDRRIELLPSRRLVEHSERIEQNRHMEYIVMDGKKLLSLLEERLRLLFRSPPPLLRRLMVI
jgi:hypothetical protein